MSSFWISVLLAFSKKQNMFVLMTAEWKCFKGTVSINFLEVV